MRVEVAALAVVDGAVGEHDQLGALADDLRTASCLIRSIAPAVRLGLEQRVSIAAARPRNSSQRSSIR